jgi:hypothetical protein
VAAGSRAADLVRRARYEELSRVERIHKHRRIRRGDHGQYVGKLGHLLAQPVAGGGCDGFTSGDPVKNGRR